MMNITKIFLLITCLSMTESFAKPIKEWHNPYSKQKDYYEVLDPRACTELTKILTELKKATPSGYRFCPTKAVQNILYDIDEPFYILINKTDQTSSK